MTAIEQHFEGEPIPFPDILAVNNGETRYEETVLFLTALFSHADHGSHSEAQAQLRQLSDRPLATYLGQLLTPVDPTYNEFVDEDTLEIEGDPDESSQLALNFYFGIDTSSADRPGELRREQIDRFEEIRTGVYTRIESSRLAVLTLKDDGDVESTEFESAVEDYERSLDFAITTLTILSPDPVAILEELQELSSGAITRTGRARINTQYSASLEKIVDKIDTVEGLTRAIPYLPGSCTSYGSLEVAKRYGHKVNELIEIMRSPEDVEALLDALFRVTTAAFQISAELKRSFRVRVEQLIVEAERTGSNHRKHVFEKALADITQGNPYAYTKLPF